MQHYMKDEAGVKVINAMQRTAMHQATYLVMDSHSAKIRQFYSAILLAGKVQRSSPQRIHSQQKLIGLRASVIVADNIQNIASGTEAARDNSCETVVVVVVIACHACQTQGSR
jgi:hypothetical protein